jgi:DNA-binding transcriptional MerR regulator
VDYRVEQLAAAARVPVDTLRFYQARGLLPAPRREGRIAIYDDAHLERLRRIRSLQQQGFTLSQIQRVLESSVLDAQEPLLAALIEESIGERTLSREELGVEAGMPEGLVLAAESAGLFEPVIVNGEPRFSEADLAMARAGLSLLEAGFPLQELMNLATRHARSVQSACDAAIDLFDDHIRKGVSATDDGKAATHIFKELLPQVTRLVAIHFQRTLVNRALNRLRGKSEHRALIAALDESESARLEVEVTWR